MEERTPLESASPAEVRSNEAELLAFIQNRDVPCPHCQYNVRNLPRPICPECDTKLVLQVGQEKPFLPAWSIMMMALWLPAGLGIVFFVGTFKLGMPPNSSIIPSMIVFWISIPLAIGALVMRDRILHWERGRQIFYAILSCGICILGYGLLLASMP